MTDRQTHTQTQKHITTHIYTDGRTHNHTRCNYREPMASVFRLALCRTANRLPGSAGPGSLPHVDHSTITVTPEHPPPRSSSVSTAGRMTTRLTLTAGQSHAGELQHTRSRNAQARLLLPVGAKGSSCCLHVLMLTHLLHMICSFFVYFVYY